MGHNQTHFPGARVDAGQRCRKDPTESSAQQAGSEVCSDRQVAFKGNGYSKDRGRGSDGDRHGEGAPRASGCGRPEMELETRMGQGWEPYVAGVPDYLYQDLRHRERDWDSRARQKSL